MKTGTAGLWTRLRPGAACLAAVLAAAAPGNGKATMLTPFGIAADRLPSSLGCSPIYGGAVDATGQYLCRHLPEGDSLFEQYILAYVKGRGICNVVAISPYIADNSRGSQTRALFRKAAALLARTLGPADEEVDHTAAGSVAADDGFRADIISQDRQVFEQWNDLAARFGNAQSASLVISGEAELGLAVYGVIRFAGNDDCLRRMERDGGQPAHE